MGFTAYEWGVQQQALINKTMSIRFHKKYFKIISHFLGFLWI